jgi:hypothetical protein
MAHRARDTVRCELVEFRIVAVGDREMREYLALAASCPRNPLGHRHVTRGTFVLDGRRMLRMIDNFAANARLPVRVARGIGHHRRAPCRPDGNILSRWGCQVVVTRHTVLGVREKRERLVGSGLGPGRLPTLRSTWRYAHDHDEPGRTGER